MAGLVDSSGPGMKWSHWNPFNLMRTGGPRTFLVNLNVFRFLISNQGRVEVWD